MMAPGLWASRPSKHKVAGAECTGSCLGQPLFFPEGSGVWTPLCHRLFSEPLGSELRVQMEDFSLFQAVIENITTFSLIKTESSFLRKLL